MVTISFRAAETGDTGQAVEAACQPARPPGRLTPAGREAGHADASPVTRSWEDNGITRYVTEILVKTTGTMQMLGSAPQQNAQAQLKPQQNGQPQSADATKKGGAKTKGRGRKAAQPEPQPQPPEGRITGFQTISRSDWPDCDNRPALRGASPER